MSRDHAIIRPLAVLVAAALAWGCKEDEDPLVFSALVARPTTVTVSPAAAELSAFGETVQLAATVRDQHARVMFRAVVEWSSSETSVATVGPSGLVTAVGVGIATITATAGRGEGSAGITVRDPQRTGLVALYEATGGPDWTNATNWLTDAPIGAWYGVSTDDDGQVVGLDLAGNGLTGPIPPELANLTNLSSLRLQSNDLSGPIPREIGNLTRLVLLRLHDNGLTGPVPESMLQIGGLRSFRFGGNAGLCTPGTSEFVAWLQAVDTIEGPYCNELDRQILEVFYETLGGPDWTIGNGWLEAPTLGGWHGVLINSLGQVTHLFLSGNELSGPIPPELGNLATLEVLHLEDNNLSGPIPPELADILRLKQLSLSYNKLSGPIPPELSSLPSLWHLELLDNELSGPIPPELGNLTSLLSLDLGYNGLTGPIPPELGKLASLNGLYLGHNDLTGPVPAEFGGLSSLLKLHLTNNPRLSGPLPVTLTGLRRLDTLMADGTRLCAPTDSGFQAWLRGVTLQRVTRCGG
ncbi:MAG: Ig-like domain-containing protein [Gammaproteobacteria bacterium]|nr:Ig-like domain-containing protein [Gammaproteobacteria bacterium]